MTSHDATAALTITIVDDEAHMQEVLLLAVGGWGFKSQVAATAEEALVLLSKQPTPVVVTDLRMPGQGGVWLVREIRRRCPGTGVIVLTGSGDADMAIECLNAGADRYLLKPLRFEELHHAIEATLRTVKLERERECHRQELEQQVKQQTALVRHTFLSAIDSLVRTLEARHPYTKGHSLRVRRYALRLGRVLGLSDAKCKQLSLAAKLHDIGKVGVPEAILNKAGQLSRAEFKVIRQHPEIGERILTPIIQNPSILAAVRGHHERLDGKGYPDGLKGRQIPLLARIIAVADTFDALTSSRAYREPLTLPRAMEALRTGAGTQFEPRFIRAFLTIAPLCLDSVAKVTKIG
jgi:response regulator RpfG family c-di-GMP phosphodiesterase